MNASTPDQTIKLFAQHLNEGDLDAAITLYEPGATFLPDPVTVVARCLTALRSTSRDAAPTSCTASPTGAGSSPSTTPGAERHPAATASQELGR